MDQLRLAAQKKAQEERTKPQRSHLILLDDTDETKTWDIYEEEQTLLITSSQSSTSPIFESVAKHVMKHGDLVDYVAIDINGDMFPNMDEDKTQRTALNLDEALALSSYLAAELQHRVSTNEWEQELLLLIKDGDNLFTIKEVDKADLYMEMLENVQAIIVAGALFGIKVLMETKTKPADTENNDFKNVIHFT